jgi:hypothetical protein
LLADVLSKRGPAPDFGIGTMENHGVRDFTAAVSFLARGSIGVVTALAMA